MFCNDSVHKDALLVSATEVRLCARIGPSLYGSVQFKPWQIVGSLCFVLILTCVLLGLHTFESLLLIENGPSDFDRRSSRSSKLLAFVFQWSYCFCIFCFLYRVRRLVCLSVTSSFLRSTSPISCINKLNIIFSLLTFANII